MTDFDKIKAKLKKLFALSRSSNANEAALALEMAQKLMAEYGIQRNAVGEFEITREEFRSNSGEKPPLYKSFLMTKIASSFGCKNAYGYKKQFGAYAIIFVGLEHRVKIASYIANVLLRKMKRARSDYMQKLSRVRSMSNKIKRADEFCFGWAWTVASKLAEFTNTPDEQAAIDIYVANLGWTDNLKLINRGKSKANDWANGRRAGAGVQIQHGVEGQEQGARLLMA